MKQPIQIGLFGKSDGSNVEYVPPDTQVMKHYVHEVCAELAQTNTAYANKEVASGLTSFLNFVAQTSARYLNSGHREYLLRGYGKRNTERRRGSNGNEKTSHQNAA